MKISLLACLCLFLPATLHADVVLPKPNLVTVSNLAAFPKIRFSYARKDDRQHTKHDLVDKKSYQFSEPVVLFAQEGREEPFPWATVEYPYPHGQRVAIVVESVRRERGKLVVSFQRKEGPSYKPIQAAVDWPSSAPHFLLAGTALCGLVVLARRQNSQR